MPLTRFPKIGPKVRNWTIYVWEEGDLIRGWAKVLTLDGINEPFVSGRTIVEDKEWQKPNKKKDKYMARSQVKTELQNTLNALNWYGKAILTKGEIDPNKFIMQELKSGKTASGIHVGLEKIHPVRKFPVKNITFDKAQEWGLT